MKAEVCLQSWSLVLLGVGSLLFILALLAQWSIHRTRVVPGRGEKLEFLKRIAKDAPRDTPSGDHESPS